MCSSRKSQHVGAIDFANRGANMVVTPAFNRKIAETDCVNCGQCAAVCPTAAITIKKDLKQVWQALYAPNKRVVAQVAPAVRVAIGEEFGLKPGKNSIGKIYTALRMCGFDTVFDTSVTADLTIVEGRKLQSLYANWKMAKIHIQTEIGGGAQTSAFFQFSLLLFFFLFFLFVQTNSIRLFIFQTIPLGRF